MSERGLVSLRRLARAGAKRVLRHPLSLMGALGSAGAYQRVLGWEMAWSWQRAVWPGSTAIQVGANTVGRSMVEVFASLVGEAGTVVAIEPVEAELEGLGRRIRQQGFRGRYVPVEAACADYDADQVTFRLGGNEETGFRQDRNALEIHGASEWSNKDKVQGGEMRTRLVTVDTVVREYGLDPQQVSVVNFTINGHEYYGIKGMPDLLRNAPRLTVAAVCRGLHWKPEHDHDIGLIDGEVDAVAIARVLAEYGFRSEVKRKWIDSRESYLFGHRFEAPVFSFGRWRYRPGAQ